MLNYYVRLQIARRLNGFETELRRSSLTSISANQNSEPTERMYYVREKYMLAKLLLYFVKSALKEH